jgi:molybdopterin synthase sulfur carrier subunit
MYICFMKVTIKAFGISRDILGGREVQIEMSGSSVNDLRQHLLAHYPALTNLNSLFIAVNQNYAEDILQLSEKDEIALIPPVSGG